MYPNDDRYVQNFATYWGISEDADGHIDQKEAYGVIALMR